MGHQHAMISMPWISRCVGACLCAALLGGCGGVELEGKVFDYAGLSGSRQKPDVTMTERAPLLVPPNVAALPTPTQTRSVAAARQDWPDDPEKVRVRVLEEEKKRKDLEEAEADTLNPFAGKETLLDKLFARSKTVEEPIPDVPEPDASDRVPTSGSAVAQTRRQPNVPHVPQAPLPDRNEDGFNRGAPGSYGNVNTGQNRAAF